MLEQPVAILLCDIADAFPSMCHSWLEFCFEKLSMPSWLQHLKHHYLSRRRASVRHGMVESACFDVRQGIWQVCVLASWLFLFGFQAILNMFAHQLSEYIAVMCALVDDVAIVVKETSASLPFYDTLASITAAATNPSSIWTNGHHASLSMKLVTQARSLGVIIGPSSWGRKIC